MCSCQSEFQMSWAWQLAWGETVSIRPFRVPHVQRPRWVGVAVGGSLHLDANRFHVLSSPWAGKSGGQGLGKREEGQNEGKKNDSEAEDSQGRDAGSRRRKLETQSEKRSGGGRERKRKVEVSEAWPVL